MEKFTIKSTFTQIEETITEITQKIIDARIGDELLFDIKLMLSEIFVNAVIHGNKKDPDKNIMVNLLLNDEIFSITIEDEGDGFDFLALKDPSAPSNIATPSGRGIFLVKNLSDRLAFNPKGNAVTFEKKLRGSVLK